MVTKDVSVPGAPFEIERVWIEDGRLSYTRTGGFTSLGRAHQGRGESARCRPARDPQGLDVARLTLKQRLDE